MNNLIAHIHNDFVFALAWTLIHSVWQFAIIVLLFLALSRFIKKSALNYRFALGFMFACIVVSLFTFYHYYSSIVEIRQLAELNQLNSGNQAFVGVLQKTISLVNDNIPWLMAIWVVGFTFHFCRTGLDYLNCRKLASSHLDELDKVWLERFENLQCKIGLDKKILYKLSHLVSSPCVIGIVKPVILIPPAMLLRLSSQQLEAVMLHELAHVQRNDYLINIIQCMAKGIFFFNPFFILLSRVIDNERENSCDDIAVHHCGSAINYSKGLSLLAELNYNNRLALAAKSNPYAILPRIKRLFGEASTQKNGVTQFICSTLVGVAGILMTAQVYAAPDSDTKNTDIETKPLVSSPAKPEAPQTAQPEILQTLNEQPKSELKPSVSDRTAVDYAKKTDKKETNKLEKIESPALKIPEEVIKAKSEQVGEVNKIPTLVSVEPEKIVPIEPSEPSNASEFSVLKDSQFSIFLLRKTVNFSDYDKVMVVPTNRYQAGFSKEKENVKKTDGMSAKQRVKLCQQFGSETERKFKKSQHFKATDNPGTNTLAILMGIQEILPSPDSKGNQKHALIRLQITIVDSASEQVIAYIEEEMPVRPPNSTQLESHPRAGDITATFIGQGAEPLSLKQVSASIADKLHEDLERLKLKQDSYFPIETAAHDYPRSAISRGMEGSCTVEFVVTKTGATRDIVPIPELCVDSNTGRPTSMWNRASVKAVSKYKYKPKLENGQPVEVQGVRHKLSWAIGRR